MQILCAHGKSHKMVTVIKLVPPMKKSLELLVLKVKALMVDNNCKNEFWIGNLKHRNLAGQEINSQMQEDEYSEEEESEEEESGEEDSGESEEEDEDN